VRSILAAAILLTTIPVAASADAPPRITPSQPAEELRLNTGVFRAGLKKRGLTELLELHLKDFPPANETEALIMMREVKLAEFADPTRPQTDRRVAIARANQILERVIKENAHDARRFEWRFALSHSLIYDEAEPFLTNILYRGGNAEDRKRLLSLSTRAVAALTALLCELADEYDRIDLMSIREFEKLEGEGYIEQLDRLAPRSEYLLLWASFYDALPRDDADPVRVRRLNEILERIARNPAVLRTPHETSHVRVQALVLIGMTNRRLNNHQHAREHLDRALAVADSLNSPAERRRIDWAVTLARLEGIRNDTDDGRFTDALRRLDKFRTAIRAQDGDNFGLKLVAALTERWVHRHRAAAAEHKGRPADAKRAREEAWRALARLASHEPDHRDELYAALYDMIGPDADPGTLDTLDQCALIAGLLYDAQQSIDTADVLLDRAIRVGERFLAEEGPTAGSLVPEVLYNIGVAQYRRGRRAAAAERFLEVAKDHAAFNGARKAAAFAAQLAAELYGNPSLCPRPQVQRLYRDTLKVLIIHYHDTDAARYWRFYYARLLDELGEYGEAAIEYAQIDPAQEHYLESMFFRARCIALALTRQAAEETVDRLILQHRIDDFFAAQREFIALATSELHGETGARGASTIRSLLALARLLGAEVHVLPHVGRPARALETLAGFEDEYPDEPALTGRIWRVRLLAYERIGRLDEAALAIPAYVAADPENAGMVLQSLYQTLVDDVESLRSTGDNISAQREAELALILAGQIYEWAARRDSGPAPSDRRALTVQLAEANLRAGRYQRACELFEPLLATDDGSNRSVESADVPVLLGHAEALYQLGEFALALPEFNRLATGLPPTDSIRWRALLRDLQCRTVLDHPPSGIVMVIQQQRQLYPELGGPAVAPELEKLQRENKRRLHKKP